MLDFGAESRGVPKEMLLQVGMIGDFIMETNRVVRQCDADDLDEAELPSILGDCEQILHHMFVEGQCMHCPCLTTSMVSMLSDPHTYIVDGHPKTIWVIKRCPCGRRYQMHDTYGRYDWPGKHCH